MLLNAGGSAKCTISLEKLGKIPEYLQVSIVSSKYADPYAADIFVSIQAVMADGTSDTYDVPVVNTGNNTCLVQIAATAVEHKYLYFTIRSSQAVTLTDWNLYPLKQSDVDLTEVLDKIPRLLKDYNEDIITVDQIETVVAMICSYVTADTELTGDFTLTFKATQATQLVVRVYDNEVEELYAPMIFYINAGYGTIGIPHAYLSKLKGYHNFAISVQVLAGSIDVQTRRVMYVIDGGRLVYSLMDVGSVVSDLALRKLFTENNYSFIYAVCLDDGNCIVKRCPYSETPGAAWVAAAILGEALDATIEFDGYWTITETPYKFTTEEFPWVAWVATDNTLYAKKLNADTTLTLATGVTKVHSVKGWDNIYTAGQDQGLLIAYVKTDGLVYYRGYCRQADESYTWETERLLSAFSGTALDVNAFRLNDFRIGINVLDNAAVTHTYITGRNYTGMSVKPECLNGSVLDPVISVVKINYIENTVKDEYLAGALSEPLIDILPPTYTDSLVVVSNAKRVDDYHISLTFNYPLTNIVGQQALFAVTGKTVTATSMGASAYEVILTVAEVLPSVGVYPVSYTKSRTGIHVFLGSAYSEPALPSFSTLAQGDPPIHETKLAGNLSSPVVTVTHITYRVGYDNTELKLAGSLSAPVITITHVGTSPL
ncbi:MAG: hypothetical protein RR382_00895 [Tannerellaceae bacterium]